MSRLEKLDDVESQDEDASRDLTWSTIVKWGAITYTSMLIVFISICSCYPSLIEVGLLSLLSHRRSSGPFLAYSHNVGPFEKPAGFDIVALVPYKHHEQTSVLDCYLQKHLVNNHGFLDKVIFIPQSNDTASLEWLASIVQETSAYSIWTSPANIYRETNRRTLFVWLDGDIVFLEDHTIPTIVRTMLDNSDSLVVSANVINQAALEALHSHSGVALPYLPELHQASAAAQLPPAGDLDWRTSNLPAWTGPKDFRVLKGFASPANKHRWLLSDDEQVDRTPISTSMYTTDGPGFTDWTVKAQQHYSFLHHLEWNELYRYKFPKWSNPTDVSPNLLCFWDADANAVQSNILPSSSYVPFGFVEDANKSSKRIVIDGKGLATHYSADAGAEDLHSTDIFQRYEAYAKEMICPNVS
ncbi:hypothetical protein IFM58399_10344 [Aspergillus lentulus]|uniref:Uncharacterized protein n=1 Tax=Aspergillus lentulus TaxID=293939 RepID=A0AAN5YUZ7_ASPLE|nr:uncharacterized protein IFM58399_10344 [Aspergillus lentulus]KAF4207889.1 hypothetical protein CNMCM8927_001779 [Aspergillus lentulus]GFF56556.1 hypothetical protein IFM58399_10344 [Aspergillus lentulus]GFF80725.1 hypothetical protein IFM62136_10367 [Aspergillus lentulus]GFF94352.1 hypothetical protein IFM60648_10384 [Aspergillus lentulus]GFF97265.1 hypothetical protein IFM47457_11306 [Aspergillus lentulus]